MVELSVVAADITTRACDLLVLKHADGFYGVDGMVSKRLGFDGVLALGKSLVFPAQDIAAKNVMFVGVGVLERFRYPQIRSFGRQALELAAEIDEPIMVICSPVHGPGYGLDERESFLSLVGGFLDAIESSKAPSDLKRIEIVEINVSRAKRLRSILAELKPGSQKDPDGDASASPHSRTVLASRSHEHLSSFGGPSERKPKLFVAMPFAPDLSDVWEIAIQEACQAAGIMCERLDEQAFTGAVLSEMKARVRGGGGVLGVLDNANPNVLLEIGFAWGAGKPTVLVAKKGATLPFDLRGEKCLLYTSINNLRTLLTAELKALSSQGVFG